LSLFNKYYLNVKSFNKHKFHLIKSLKFKDKPTIFTGDKAFNYAKHHIPECKGKKREQIPYSGFFHYQNLPEKYTKTGVVCIFYNEVPALAHELRHAKQYQDQSWWLVNKDNLKWLKIYYKCGYRFYPSEIVAYFYAVKYLFITKEFKLCFKYSFKKTLFPYIAIVCIILISLFFINP
jgi:hypothetical protein